MVLMFLIGIHKDIFMLTIFNNIFVYLYNSNPRRAYHHFSQERQCILQVGQSQRHVGQSQTQVGQVGQSQRYVGQSPRYVGQSKFFV
jgi:hypothetical protein